MFQSWRNWGHRIQTLSLSSNISCNDSLCEHAAHLQNFKAVGRSTCGCVLCFLSPVKLRMFCVSQYKEEKNTQNTTKNFKMSQKIALALLKIYIQFITIIWPTVHPLGWNIQQRLIQMKIKCKLHPSPSYEFSDRECK